MSDMLTHVLVGNLVGEAITSLSLPFGVPLAATIGFASHAVLDVVDNDYTINWTNKASLRRDMFLVLLQMFGIVLQVAWIVRHPSFTTAIAIVASIAPDIIDGVVSLINPKRWQRGDLIFPWHRPGNRTKQQTRSQAIRRSLLLILVVIMCNWIGTAIYG